MRTFLNIDGDILILKNKVENQFNTQSANRWVLTSQRACDDVEPQAVLAAGQKLSVTVWKPSQCFK